MPDNENAPQQETPVTDLSNLLVRSPQGGVHHSYGNLVRIDWTLTDVHVRVGELMYTTDLHDPLLKNQIPIFEDRVSVTIPWQQAKILRDLLIGVIDSYESVNGELKPLVLPPSPTGPNLTTSP